MHPWLGYVICDLDGCLADDRWRRLLLPVSIDGDYLPYHQHCGQDECVQSVLSDVLYSAYDEDAQRSLVLFVTSRPESVREQTAGWIDSVFAVRARGFRYELLMRPERSRAHSPELKVALVMDYLNSVESGWHQVVAAYDDRQDVLAAYPIDDDRRFLRVLDPYVTPSPHGTTVPDILRAMAATYAERNEVYRDNYTRVAPVIKALWPAGVPSDLVLEDRWHLFELLVVKLTRFATSGLSHTDSIHDAAVYAAMIEADLSKEA